MKERKLSHFPLLVRNVRIENSQLFFKVCFVQIHLANSSHVPVFSTRLCFPKRLFPKLVFLASRNQDIPTAHSSSPTDGNWFFSQRCYPPKTEGEHQPTALESNGSTTKQLGIAGHVIDKVVDKQNPNVVKQKPRRVGNNFGSRDRTISKTEHTFSW